MSKVNKPKYLYHASANRHIKVIKPQRESFRDEKEGPVVFATLDKAYASCFLVGATSDSWTSISRWSEDPKKKGSWHFICSDEKRFKKEDNGGAIYVLSSDKFTTDMNKGVGLTEWVSKADIVPLRKIIYKSALEAMLSNGVQVIFTDKKTMRKIRASKDKGYSIVSKLTSENEKLITG